MNETSQIPLAHSVTDACRRVGIGRTKIYELIAEKRIHPIKLGTRTLIPESELVRLLNELTEQATA